jgi:hypothetical protein
MIKSLLNIDNEQRAVASEIDHAAHVLKLPSGRIAPAASS